MLEDEETDGRAALRSDRWVCLWTGSFRRAGIVPKIYGLAGERSDL